MQAEDKIALFLYAVGKEKMQKSSLDRKRIKGYS